MQKILAFLVLLMLPWVARGQALADWYYWFDYDSSPRMSGKANSQQFQLQPDVSHLPTGVHTLYVQVVDTAGVYSSPVGTMFFKVPDANAIDKLFYTVDVEETPTVLGFGNGTFSLDVSKYQAGFHRINLQVMDNQGGVSDVMPYLFYKVPHNTHLSQFRYWFDNEGTVHTMPYGQGHYILDVAHLTPGFHFVNYYVADGEENITRIDKTAFLRLPMASNQKLHYWFAGDTVATHVPNFQDGFIVDVTRLQEGFNTIYFQLDDNGPTDIMSENFIKILQTEEAGDMTLICIIDGKVVGEEKVSAHGGVIKCDMDVSNMEVGLHKAMFQLITPTGSGSSIAETYFVRTLTNEDVASMQCSYTIDGFRHRVHKGTSTNGVFHFDLPVEDVEDGLHRIDYMLVAENGASTTQGSAWFFKTPVGGNGITQYDYWLNDKSDVVQSVVLDEPKDPFQLIKLLPVSKEQIRTDCFHFEVKDGSPMMYAKNDIHFRFHDKSGRYVDADKQYVDYNVQQKVKDIMELLPTQTFERPESNSIKWFKFDAAPGDTIAFRSSQATSLQVFAPSGKEIYAASGDKSVKFGGAHTWETGTYYIAVHDVTGSKPDITLDYMHMDKYAVLSHTPTVQGNIMSTFQMDLFGNGFDKLKSAILKYKDDTLVVDTIVTKDISNTTIYFTIDKSIENGTYDLVLTYNDNGEEDMLTVKDALKVEKPAFGDIRVSVGHKYSNINPVTLTITITNPGNVNYTYVPFNIAWDKPDNISSIKFNNFWLSMTEELDSLGYKNIVITNNLLDKKVRGGIMYLFIPSLKAHETMEIKLDISFRKPAVTSKVYAWCGTPLERDTATHVLYSGMRRSYNAQTARNILSAGDVAENATGIRGVPPSVSHAGQAANTAAKIGVTFAGIMEASDHAVDMAYLDAYGIDKDSDLGQEIAGLHGQGLLTPGEIIGGDLGNFVDGLLGLHRDCSDNPTPEPEGEGGAAHHIAVDPNDIYGYIAPSGSKFIGEEIMTLPYRIEFENDTTFATASAHTVIVTDTLDSTKFDLASFEPTSIKIGDKNVQLNGEKEFVTTVDMRPEIYAIAQIEGMYDEKKGIATWKFSSLDPMTMEETDDVMQGFLPVNYDGSGIGEVAYNINRKGGLADGTEISNKASIIFDSNDAIETPVWTNTIDAVPPTSSVADVVMQNDSVAIIHFEGADERSGVWKYELYVQHGEGSGWWKEAETDSTCCGFRFYNNIKYSFCVLATDSAGNVERKEFAPEKILYVGRKGDVNTDGEVNVTDIVYTADHILGNVDEAFNASAADMNDDKEINVTDIVYIADEILNGDVDQRSAVKSNRSRTVTNSADALTIEPFNIDSGETKVVTLEMNNPGYDITAFQCDVTLPNGLHIAKSGNGKQGINFNKETKRADASTHSLAAMSKDAGVNRFVCYSITNAPFFGYTGAVIDIPVTADATMADGEYTVLIDNITMTCKDKTQLKPAPVMVKISVNNATSVHSLNADDPSAEYYDVGGRKRDTISKGVNIIRKNDNVNKVIK